MGALKVPKKCPVCDKPFSSSSGYQYHVENVCKVKSKSVLEATRPKKSSSFKGLSWISKKKKWRARVTVNTKTISLGYFSNEHEAAAEINGYLQSRSSTDTSLSLRRKNKRTLTQADGNITKTKDKALKTKTSTKMVNSDNIIILSSRPTCPQKSKFKGVSWYQPLQQWVARISIKGKPLHLGYFDDEKAAACKYEEFATAAGRHKP